ncbi:MAG: F0F1 ATP synthase subunit A [Chitinophagaceae bacterium]|nr:F0F1 ATP synthase subunit A [Chitinophagaceae bacterium]
MAFKGIKSLLVAALAGFLLLNSGVAKAQHEGEIKADTTATHGEKEFDITETIMDHVKDSYGWHLWGHTSVHLPVMLYTDKGLEVFSSKNLRDEHHQPVVYNGKNSYKLNHETGKIEILNADGTSNTTAKLFDFSITKNVATLLLSMLLVCIIFLSIAKAYQKRGVNSAPKGLQSFLEPIILFVRDDIAKPNIGPKYTKYMPFLLSIFFFIWLNNMLGLIPFFPGGANLSGNIAFTMVLALIVFVVVNVSANKNYWKHIFWMPGVAWPMKLFLAPIELMGVFIKPISLMIRLFANITAGHILVLALICLIFVFKAVAAAAVAVPFAVFIYCIELLVAFLQAFIFTMLTALYIGMAIEEHHHEEAHH